MLNVGCQLALLNRASVAGWHYWSTSARVCSLAGPNVTPLHIGWKTEGNYNSTWSFLSSTGGSEGLRRAQTSQRELLIPPSGQTDFLINAATSSGPDRNKVAQKRSMIVLESPDELEIWDQGCRTAQAFARSGSRYVLIFVCSDTDLIRCLPQAWFHCTVDQKQKLTNFPIFGAEIS